MHATTVIGYSWQADMHCVDCTRHAANVGLLKREPPLSMDTDEHGLATDLVDSEGNEIHPVFAGDEGASDERCGDCGDELMS